MNSCQYLVLRRGTQEKVLCAKSCRGTYCGAHNSAVSGKSNDSIKKWRDNIFENHPDKASKYLIRRRESARKHNALNKEKYDTIVECECGRKFQLRFNYKHLQTAYHTQWVKRKIASETNSVLVEPQFEDAD